LSIDLDTTEGRKQYLSDKLDDLLDGINESYGTILMEELLARLELTIKDFNDEMKTLCQQLIKKQEERQHLLEMLKSTKGIHSQKVSGKVSNEDGNLDLDSTTSETSDLVEDLSSIESEDIPAWEKKLAKLEKKSK
jgi:hypothetical protein